MMAVAIFLDIEEVFKNALQASLYKAIMNREIEKIICNWIRTMLQNRIIMT